MSDAGLPRVKPTILPLGDAAVLVRFATSLSESANNAAVALAHLLGSQPVPGVVEITPNLVSVLVRYDPALTDPGQLAGELRLRLAGLDNAAESGEQHKIKARFGGAAGPDLPEVAALLGMEADAFVQAHNRAPLRVLATGFAPGFVYCGFHGSELVLPRRTAVRRAVPAGSVLFAAGQTAIAATEIPTGWHVIGRTEFRNFDPAAAAPTRLAAGDAVQFEVQA
ncbi:MULTISPECIES: allophanate hydrolase subunit 1 [unclassified Devosia]|uniref:5-oxoprolinase subunit B family protein n=1 Tax=unclassified Devosia TaxID=196773 RepID=UPI001552DB6F|nr:MULTISPECIES: allophanate hydrolase subunit 1 [unclassified Devosia]